MNGADKQYPSEKRPVYIKRDPYTWKETNMHEKRLMKETIPKRYPAEKRPIYMERDPYTWKETYLHEKRPIYMKRDLYI